MTPDLVWKALLLGMINAAPFGPVGMMCLRKNVEPHRLPGLMAGFGMAVAYAVISFCVLFGLNGIGRWLDDYRVICQVLAGITLVVMGWQGLAKKAVSDPVRPCPKRLAGDFTQSFALTLFNPIPFASFAFILTSFHIVRGKLDLFADLLFASLVFVGTAAFWLAMNQILHWIKSSSGGKPYGWIIRGSSIALIVFGAMILLKGAIEKSQL